MSRVMRTSGSASAPRVFRITPWPIRIGAPLVALVVILVLIDDRAAAAIPVPIVLAAAWLYAAERCGLVVSTHCIESRMTRRENTFRQPWHDIDSFELVENGAQVAIAMQLPDGSRKLLSSTRAWFWDKSKVRKILLALQSEQATVENSPSK